MILTQVLAHLESNAAFYTSHEPLKCSAIFLLYSLIDWFTKEEEACSSSETTDGKPCFSFIFDGKKEIASYLSEKLNEIEPHAVELRAQGFPLRA